MCLCEYHSSSIPSIDSSWGIRSKIIYSIEFLSLSFLILQLGAVRLLKLTFGGWEKKSIGLCRTIIWNSIEISASAHPINLFFTCSSTCDTILSTKNSFYKNLFRSYALNVIYSIIELYDGTLSLKILVPFLLVLFLLWAVPFKKIFLFRAQNKFIFSVRFFFLSNIQYLHIIAFHHIVMVSTQNNFSSKMP